MRYLFKDPRLYTYDRDNNPDRLNIFELSADGIEWSEDGRSFKRYFKEKGIACEVPGANRISFIELFPSIDQNEAFLIDRNNNVLALATTPIELKNFRLAPYDVYMLDGLIEILFEDLLGYTYDYRIDYRPSDFSIVSWNPTK